MKVTIQSSIPSEPHTYSLPGPPIHTITFFDDLDWNKMLFPVLSLATAALALPYLEERQTVSSKNCTTTGVHMIVARASTENPGIGGLLAPLVSGIEKYLPGSDAVGVEYPATLVNYGTSVNSGVSSTFDEKGKAL